LDSSSQQNNAQEVPQTNGIVAVIDDNEQIVEYLVDILEEYDFEVISYTNPKKYLKEIEISPAEVVLSDISMPQMDGLDLLKKIRSHGVKVPIIFISGHVTKEALMQGMSLGVSGFIEKPFEIHDIVSLVKNAMSRVHAYKRLNQSANNILLQIEQLNEYLVDNGKSEERDQLRSELESLLEQRNRIFELL
jgi:FixJ family two-component response regulator